MSDFEGNMTPAREWVLSKIADPKIRELHLRNGTWPINGMFWRMGIYQQVLDGNYDNEPKMKIFLVGDGESDGLVSKRSMELLDRARLGAPITWMKTIQVGRTVSNLSKILFSEGARLGIDHPSLIPIAEGHVAGDRSRIISGSELFDLIDTPPITPEEADKLI